MAPPNAEPSVARVPLDQEQVVDAAAERWQIAEGLDALTLTRVAQVNSGVRQPALYRHVESYQDLLRLLGLARPRTAC